MTEPNSLVNTGVETESSQAQREHMLRAIEKTQAYILREGYKGYDPYDALTSPLFKLPFLNTNKLVRLGAQQVLKRLPLNLRPMLFVPKGYNPVTLGLCVQAYVYLAKSLPEQKAFYEKEINRLIVELIRLQSSKMRSEKYSGACWGYDFDWEARYAKIPAYVPTIVATGFITNALFEAYSQLGNQRAFELCESATKFVVNDLNRTEKSDGRFCWSYSPRDKQIVLNATMKGARLCAQVGSVNGEKELLDLAKRTVEFVMQHQDEHGAWRYAIGDTRAFVDNFHTGYVLDCLDEYQTLSGDKGFQEGLQKGWRYYRENFFVNDQEPKYYDKSVYPIDATACAQSLLTLSRFGDHKTAERVAGWVIKEMQLPNGAFKYQRYAHYENRIPYMRWSTAWLFLGLSRVVWSNISR